MKLNYSKTFKMKLAYFTLLALLLAVSTWGNMQEKEAHFDLVATQVLVKKSI